MLARLLWRSSRAVVAPYFLHHGELLAGADQVVGGEVEGADEGPLDNGRVDVCLDDVDAGRILFEALQPAKAAADDLSEQHPVDRIVGDDQQMLPVIPGDQLFPGLVDPHGEVAPEFAADEARAGLLGAVIGVGDAALAVLARDLAQASTANFLQPWLGVQGQVAAVENVPSGFLGARQAGTDGQIEADLGEQGAGRGGLLPTPCGEWYLAWIERLALRIEIADLGMPHQVDASPWSRVGPDCHRLVC